MLSSVAVRLGWCVALYVTTPRLSQAGFKGVGAPRDEELVKAVRRIIQETSVKKVEPAGETLQQIAQAHANVPQPSRGSTIVALCALFCGPVRCNPLRVVCCVFGFCHSLALRVAPPLLAGRLPRDQHTHNIVVVASPALRLCMWPLRTSPRFSKVAGTPLVQLVRGSTLVASFPEGRATKHEMSLPRGLDYPSLPPCQQLMRSASLRAWMWQAMSSRCLLT